MYARLGGTGSSDTLLFQLFIDILLTALTALKSCKQAFKAVHLDFVEETHKFP